MTLEAVPDLIPVTPETSLHVIEEFMEQERQRFQREARILQNRINSLVQQNTELQQQLALAERQIALMSSEEV